MNNQEEERKFSSGCVLTTSGIGIGISTSAALAQAMGGSLKVDSQKENENEEGVPGTKVTMQIECFKVD